MCICKSGNKISVIHNIMEQNLFLQKIKRMYYFKMTISYFQELKKKKRILLTKSKRNSFWKQLSYFKFFYIVILFYAFR